MFVRHLRLAAIAIAIAVGPVCAFALGDGAPVQLEGKTLFMVRTRLGPFSPEERARATSARLLNVAQDRTFPVEELAIARGENGLNLVAGGVVLMTVTEQDARAAGVPQDELAGGNLASIRSAITLRREDYNLNRVLLRILYAALATFGLVLVLAGFRRFFPVLFHKVAARRGAIPSLHFQRAELVSAERITKFILRSIKALRWALVIIVVYLYATLLFSFFPLTRDYTPALVGYVFTPLGALGSAFLEFVPNLAVILVMIAFAWGCIRLSRFLFDHIATGAIAWRGFYPDWAEPTHKIVRFLILAFTAVVTFPYLPGSNSPAFRGISIFLGVLISLGSSGAVANIVAGVILTYTRAFRLGDRVKIADTLGDVVESTLLATRVRSIKNEIITVPNSMVLGAHITNFTSRSGGREALILHTSVTIGYDAPWRAIHELLTAAAARTSHILPDPKPFVWQTALDDFFVRYEINGYTDHPELMPEIYAELHQNIQDCFNEAGVEIMSPHYTSMRDGNRKAIPGDYLPKSYEPPFFRVGPDRDRKAAGAE
jgi:small-conductance mechanosensitive channel